LFKVQGSRFKVQGSRFKVQGSVKLLQPIIIEMARVKRFEDLEIWKLAREICKIIYHFIEATSLGKNYALRGKMDKCSGSVMDNIEEGFEQNGN